MLEYLIHGGWALWIIAGCSVVALGVTLERLQTLRRADLDSEALIREMLAAVKGGDTKGALAACARHEGPIAATLAVGLRKLEFLRALGKRPEEIERGIVEAMEDHGGHAVEYLERNLNLLATIASLAPILGMMGTVVGMIRAFGTVGRMGNMTPEAVAVGISEALLCTAGGLIVAAMSTVEYNYFVARVSRLVLAVQSAGTELVERLLENQVHAIPGSTGSGVSGLGSGVKHSESAGARAQVAPMAIAKVAEAKSHAAPAATAKAVEAKPAVGRPVNFATPAPAAPVTPPRPPAAPGPAGGAGPKP